ncbi:ribbon-helix-helix domain-containing protein [Paenibacillus sp. GCM10027626]|uniref:ribbon-helix-helix domain-containing protein n=1 Tax=Paenibacillus sp. GCM10027626 TaxID=3273411 RepID=UPI00363EE714
MELINNKDSGCPTGSRGGSRKGAGRKPIGTTRKISLTLPQACWDEIDRYCHKGDYSVSEVLRSIIEDNLHNADLL